MERIINILLFEKTEETYNEICLKCLFTLYIEKKAQYKTIAFWLMYSQVCSLHNSFLFFLFTLLTLVSMIFLF